MATLWSIMPWVFSFLGSMALVAEVMYEIVTLSDLENDYLNPRECRKRLQWLQVPAMAMHGVVTASFFVFGHWIFLSLNLPLLALLFRQLLRKQHLIDETEIFKELKGLMRWRVGKLIFYISLVVLLMFRLILAAFE